MTPPEAQPLRKHLLLMMVLGVAATAGCVSTSSLPAKYAVLVAATNEAQSRYPHAPAVRHNLAAAYTVTPQRSYRDAAKRLCRKYTSPARIDGRDERVHGTACRQPDGIWRQSI